MSEPVKAVLIGPTGRLGGAIARALIEAADFELHGAVVSPASSAAGGDAGTLLGLAPAGVRITTDLEAALDDGAGIVIDASVPDMTVAAAERLAAAGGPPLVSGVTGLSEAQTERLNQAGQRLAILQADNFSLGVAVAEALVRQAARLPAQDWDIEIHEAHHRAKADAPSGTALMLGRAAAEVRGDPLDRLAVWAREGQAGPRPDGAIGFAVTRGGSIVGEHTVRFVSEMEEIAISHRAFDRAVFARGALEAARWMVNTGKGRPSGCYAMSDVVAG